MTSSNHLSIKENTIIRQTVRHTVSNLIDRLSLVTAVELGVKYALSETSLLVPLLHTAS